MPSQRQNQIRKGVWMLCVTLTIILEILGLTSSKWVSGGGNEVGLSKRCLSGTCTSVGVGDLPPSWGATLVLGGFSVGFNFVTFFCIVVLFKYNRDRVLFTSKCCCAFANLLLFIAMLVWPIGLGDKKFVPCDDGIDAEAYHMCNPWDLDMGLYLMIIAMIFMTFAMCLSTLVTSKVSQRDADRLKRKRRETQGWYDPSNPRGTKPSGEQTKDEAPAAASSSSSKKGGAAGAAAAGGAAASSAPSRLKAVKEEEPEQDSHDIGYLMIEAKGLQGWGEPEPLQSGRGVGGPAAARRPAEEDNNQSSYFNPYFNDEEEFL